MKDEGVVTLELSQGLLGGFFLITSLFLMSFLEESNPEERGTSDNSSVPSSFFMKSVKELNLSSSDILLGVTSSELRVVSGGGSEADLGVVKGAKEVGGSWVLKRLGLGLNLRGKGLLGRGLNLSLKNFFLSSLTGLTSFKSLSTSSSLISSSSS